MLSTLNRQHGLTLIELMVAMLLSLMLMAGMITVFQANKTTYKTQDGLAQLQENGRMALELLSRDFRNIGYKGCGGRSAGLYNVLSGASGYLWDFDVPVDGFEADGSGGWAPSPGSDITGKTPDPDAIDSDIVTLRVFDGIGARVTSHASGPSNVTVNGYADIDDGDILMVGDCREGAVFQVTSIDSSGEITLGATGSPGNASTDLGRSFSGSDVARLAVRTYYVATGTYTGARSALWVVENDGAAQELIQGIDALQIQYGRDTNGDRLVDDYVAANSVTDWAAVVAVRLNVLASSLDDNVVDGNQTYTFAGTATTATDRRLRQGFSTTIALRNSVP